MAIEPSGVIRFGRIEDAMHRYSLGRNLMLDLGREAKATLKYGKCSLYDFDAIDQYLTQMRIEQNGGRA